MAGSKVTKVAERVFLSKLKAIAGHHNAGKTADLILRCDGKEYPINHFLLHLHSDALGASVASNAAGRYLDLSDDDPECVRLLATYIYTFDYPATELGALSLHVKMAVFADKYGVQDLFDLALQYFTRDFPRSREGFQNRIADCSSAVALAYETDGPTAAFRSVVVDALIEAGAGSDIEGGGEGDLNEIIGISHQLEVDIVVLVQRRTVHEVGASIHTFTCMRCGKKFEKEIPATEDFFNCPSGTCDRSYTGVAWHRDGLPKPLVDFEE